jgi:SAM-dependent methyltransferase
VIHEDRVRAGSFGDDALLYDRARPSYPAPLLDALVDRSGTDVLDVGCGTGIASRLFAKRGCSVLGVEPDDRMASVARGHGLAVECARFEEWQAHGRTFDLLISGQAWHWVDPRAGAAKAAAVLRPSGVIGLFWNQGRPAGDVAGELDRVYESAAPGLEEYSILLRPLGTDRFQAACEGLAETGAFDGPAITTHPWSRSYTRDEWLDHLMTHSDHRTLAPVVRSRLLDSIAAVLDRAGGTFTVNYTCWLVRAVRR